MQKMKQGFRAKIKLIKQITGPALTGTDCYGNLYFENGTYLLKSRSFLPIFWITRLSPCPII